MIIEYKMISIARKKTGHVQFLFVPDVKLVSTRDGVGPLRPRYRTPPAPDEFSSGDGPKVTRVSRGEIKCNTLPLVAINKVFTRSQIFISTALISINK